MSGRDRGDIPVVPERAQQEGSPQLGDEARALRLQQYQRANAERQAVAAPQQPKDYKYVTNSDGTITVSFNDNTSVRLDPNRRPLEVTDAQGRKTTFGYTDGTTGPTSYKVSDKSGNVLEEGSKGAKDTEFQIKYYKDGKEVPGENRQVTEIKMTPDGQLDFVSKGGLHFERQRSGNQLVRDASGRILQEKTPGERQTEYTYEGNSSQPASALVKDAKGNITEYAVKGEKGWSLYKPKAGEAGLDPKALEDPAKLVNDRFDKLVDVQVNQRNGMRVETLGNGDRVWSTDKHDYRMNPSGCLSVLEKLPDGKVRLVSFRDAQGVRTAYDYDDDGKLKAEVREYPNGQKRSLVRQGDGDSAEWKNSEGKKINCKAELLADGSVQMTYADAKQVFVQCASGAELVKRIDADGKARLVHSTDTKGFEIQYGYDDKTNGLARLEVSRPLFTQDGRRMMGRDGQPAKETIVWQKTGEKDGQEIWQTGTGGGKKTFIGTQKIEEDGSLVRTDADPKPGTPATMVFSIRGLVYAVADDAKPKK